MWELESRRVTGGNPWGEDQVWGLQELILFKLMELPVNGVRSVTSSGAIAAVHFGKTKGVAEIWSWFSPRDWSWLQKQAWEGKKKKDNIDL